MCHVEEGRCENCRAIRLDILLGLWAEHVWHHCSTRRLIEGCAVHPAPGCITTIAYLFRSVWVGSIGLAVVRCHLLAKPRPYVVLRSFLADKLGDPPAEKLLRSASANKASLM